MLNKRELVQSFCSRMSFQSSTSRNHLLELILFLTLTLISFHYVMPPSHV